MKSRFQNPLSKFDLRRYVGDKAVFDEYAKVRIVLISRSTYQVKPFFPSSETVPPYQVKPFYPSSETVLPMK